MEVIVKVTDDWNGAIKNPELIRCRECKYRGNAAYAYGQASICCIPPHMNCDQLDGTDEYWLDVDDDDYCSRAERRTE